MYFLSILDKMLQVDPVKRPDISEIVTDLERIALSRYVELKGSIVSFMVLFVWKARLGISDADYTFRLAEMKCKFWELFFLSVDCRLFIVKKNRTKKKKLSYQPWSLVGILIHCTRPIIQRIFGICARSHEREF